MVHFITPEMVKKTVKIPKVAIPTLLLACLCIIVFLSANFCLLNKIISPYTCFIVNLVTIFAAFTPMHDAAHGSIATNDSGYRWLNTLVGYSMGCMFPLPYAAFKTLHLKHHKYTNQPEDDVDAWASGGPVLFLPLRWMTTEIMYYIHYLPKLHTRPLSEAVGALTQLCLCFGSIIALYRHGFETEVLWGWLLPGKVAIAFLAFAFDYLPHRCPPTISGPVPVPDPVPARGPGDVTTHHLLSPSATPSALSSKSKQPVSRMESEYLATSVTSLCSQTDYPLLTWILLYQNYHNIHHLVPYIPFYTYSRVWIRFEKELLARGTAIQPIFRLNSNSNSGDSDSNSPIKEE